MTATGAATDVAGRIAAALGASAFDAVVVVGVENAQYCAQARLHTAHELDRPNIVVWPRGEAPALLTSVETVAPVRAASWIEDVIGYDERGAIFPAGIVEPVVERLRERGVAGGRIGVEALRTPAAFRDRLQALLPDAAVEPCDELFRALRMVKTPGELERMRQGAERLEQAILAAIRGARGGETERAMSARIDGELIVHGFERPDTLLGTGEGAARISPPTGRRLAEGDLVRIDTKVARGPYYADMGRMAVVGEPAPEQRAAYREQLELRERLLELLRPGTRCSAVARGTIAAAERMGARLLVYGHIGAGHGIGVSGTERPVLHVTDDTVLEPGMVVNLEPDTIAPGGEIVHVEDMALIADGGCELLTWSHDWSELPVIGA